MILKVNLKMDCDEGIVIFGEDIAINFFDCYSFLE